VVLGRHRAIDSAIAVLATARIPGKASMMTGSPRKGSGWANAASTRIASYARVIRWARDINSLRTALELGQGGENVEDELATGWWRRSFRQAAEPDAGSARLMTVWPDARDGYLPSFVQVSG
jgi:hypothetical protein